MIVTAFFQLLEFEFEFVDIRRLHLVLDRLDGQLSFVDKAEFAIVQVNDVVGVFDDRRSVGGDEEFAFLFADTDDDRTAFAGADELVRMVFGRTTIA